MFSSDNGYHLGQHRVGAGKTLPYLADTNVPFIVRGPNVPNGETSRLPGTHLDLAPTFLDIACVDQTDLPVFLDGRSLLDDWQSPQNSTGSSHQDLINIEFWGHSVVELPTQKGSMNNSYKALRVVGEDSAYLFTRWCTGETELYNTLVSEFQALPSFQSKFRNAKDCDSNRTTPLSSITSPTSRTTPASTLNA